MTHQKSYTLGEIAEFLGDEVVGDKNCEIHGLGTLSGAGPSQLSFLSNQAYLDQLSSTTAAAVIVDAKFADRCPGNALISTKPYVSFAKASALFALDKTQATGVHPSAVVAADVNIPADASVGP